VGTGAADALADADADKTGQDDGGSRMRRVQARAARDMAEEGHTNLVVANRHGLETALQAGTQENYGSALFCSIQPTETLATPFVCLVSRRI
jgi:hypothetical protein